MENQKKNKLCKICRKPFAVIRPLQAVCGYQCAITLSNIQKAKTNAAEQKKQRQDIKQKKQDLLTIPEIIKIVQQKVNQYIRMRDLGKTCVSCDQVLHENLKYDAGHFYSTQYSFLRFDYSNIHGQCVKCNQHEHSNPHEYRKRIVSRIGMCELQRLDQTARTPVKWSRENLYAILEDAKVKIKKLKDQKK